ncbi:cytochrome c biogenesis protein ResB [Staphylospora marina]|uniref:cytochrome c biogenesis protein ResB n=1 Tax=Staphylospora marina TaxID=2490858 RepID=UPI0013DD921A|nr:cytochrome c biogenesis protein ResB [Staphylospora marina]
MIVNSKCECGHNNPVGTILCEYCGKPLEKSVREKTSIEREMRYEGKARRSLRAPASPFDLVWNFFSSVKVAITLIVVTLVAAAIGTVLPQERFIPSADPVTYYAETYGFWGKLFYQLGLTDMYNSWWFFLLISSIGVSLVVCSLDRVIPLWKALSNQQVAKNPEFIRKQGISHEETLPREESIERMNRLAEALEGKHYRIRREEEALLAEKGRISRWGPYVNHVGLILFLFGVLLRYVPGWHLQETMWVREGQIAQIPETDLFVKNEKFTMETWDTGTSSEEKPAIPKKFQTDAVIFREDPKTGTLTEVHRQSILVNEPLKYGDLLLYQADYRMGVVSGLTLNVTEKTSGRQIGTFRVDLYDLKPDQVFRVGQLEIRPLEYYPDFALENGRPVTKSREPNRPAFIFEVREQGQKEGERSWVIAGQDLGELAKDNRYEIGLANLNLVNSSGLLVRVDKSLPIIFVGGFIFFIGLIMGFWWQHRRVWIRVTDGGLVVGAHTNKNWFSLRRELERVFADAGMTLPPASK